MHRRTKKIEALIREILSDLRVVEFIMLLIDNHHQQLTSVKTLSTKNLCIFDPILERFS